MPHNVLTKAKAPGLQRNRGVSLVFALIALTVLSLAAVALVRSVDTGTLVLGNMGFKQDATKSGDQGAEQAVTWISGQLAGSGSALDNDKVVDDTTAYWATSHDTLDPTGANESNTARSVIDWDKNGCASYRSGTFSGGCLRPLSGTAVNGNKVQYVILRLCPAAGAANSSGNDCARPVAPVTEPVSITRGEFNYRKYERFDITNGASATSVYYRIIVQTVGGKNAVSFTETIVHF